MAQPIEQGGPCQEQPAVMHVTGDMFGMGQGMEVITPVGMGLAQPMSLQEQYDQANGWFVHCERSQARVETWHEDARGWLSRHITGTMVKVSQSNTQRAKQRFDKLDAILHPDDRLPIAAVQEVTTVQPAVQTYTNHGKKSPPVF